MQNFIAIKGFSISTIVLIFFKPPVKTSLKSSASGDFDSGRNRPDEFRRLFDLFGNRIRGDHSDLSRPRLSPLQKKAEEINLVQFQQNRFAYL